jgi:hypothetical protein
MKILAEGYIQISIKNDLFSSMKNFSEKIF